MILPPEYFWLESFLNNDSLWFEDSLNWDDAFNLVFNEWTLYSFFTTPFFFNSYIFSDYITKLSILDIIFLIETDKTNFSREFFDYFIWDITNYIQIKYLPTQFFFYSDYQDFMVIIMYHSPELMIGFLDYFNNFLTSNAASYIPNAVYDLFSDHMNSAVIELVEHFILFFSFIWLVIIFTSLFRLIKWSNSTEIYFVRLYMYFFNISKDFRLQFEAVIQTFFFIFFFWTMMISTFDDDKEELIEFFDINCFYFFFLIIFYLLFKYSQHYFSFLEASVTEGRTILFVAKQFFRDFINTFALFLRFFILVFRLNVYDTLDDFYDSYYIYVGDFDEDEYYFEAFFFYQALFSFSNDNNDDGNFSLEDENDFFFDLFFLYFVCWSKLFFFLFFILEEVLRLALAFYICYLIIFEVHAVNSSYIEDTYFFKTREELKKFIILPFFKAPFRF